MKELLGLLRRSFIIIGVFLYAFASSSIFLLPIIFDWHVAFGVLGDGADDYFTYKYNITSISLISATRRNRNDFIRNWNYCWSITITNISD